MSGPPALAARTAAGSAADLLAALDPEQRAAAGAPLGPVCILAGAGTGKTRTITHRIAHMVADAGVGPGQILAVSFTARAAGELRGRLRAMDVDGVQARTFHSAALRQLGYFWPAVAGVGLPRPEKSKIAYVARAAGRLRLRLDRAELRDLTSEIEWAKASLVGPDDYARMAVASGRETTSPPATVARLYAAYEEAKRDAGVIDMEDILLLTAAMIEEHSWVAAEVRARYRHFVVDEYQDVNALQQRVLDAWLGERDSLCVVGDPNQTIYSFTGASPEYLVGFPRRFPAAAVVRLVRDYRSTPQVVALANTLVRAAPAGRLVAVRPAGPAPVWLECDSEPAEATAVAARIRRLLSQGVPASGIAVLYRINAQSEAYEAAIGGAGIPYLLRGGEKFFERPEVVQAIRLLRAATRSADADRPAELVAVVADVLSALGWQATAPTAGTGAERERWENLAALHRLAGDLAERSPDADLDAFVAELADRASHEHLPTVEGVTLSTLHAAKGLEWDAVFLVGLADGTLPLVHARTAEQIAEERRLLYVGITRARVHLFLSWALARTDGGRRSRRPSRFLDDLRPVRGEGAVPAARGPRPGDEREPRADGGRTRNRAAVPCRVCGRSLTGAEARVGRCEACPADVDAALYGRLRDWRARRAKEQSKPQFVVLTDATLKAVAECRPSSVAELVKLPGIGQVKLNHYGEDILALVAGRMPAPADQPTAD